MPSPPGVTLPAVTVPGTVIGDGVVPSAPGVTLPGVTIPGTAIGDGVVKSVGGGGRMSVRPGFGDVIWASAVPQPNTATARSVISRRFIQASCVHLRFYIPSFDRWRSAADRPRWTFAISHFSQ